MRTLIFAALFALGACATVGESGPSLRYADAASRGAFAALLAGRPQELTANPDGRYQLFRVGDAVASRNIHAAIYDSLRLCKNF